MNKIEKGDEISFNGYIPSPEDERDYKFDTVFKTEITDFPSEYRTNGNVTVLNQGVNSDCVAHALAVAAAYGECKMDKPYHELSRGYIYGNRDEKDHQGEGMVLRQALKQFNHCGDCLENDFPYKGMYPTMKALIEEKKEEYAEKAKPFKILNYFRLYTEEEIKKTLILQGSVVLGITVYEGFTTHIPVPVADAKAKGGHAMCCVGWNKEGWILQNSWGKMKGDKGFYYLPYNYPVKEWWGFTVDPTLPTPPKKNILKRILGFLESILRWFAEVFGKKE